MEREERWKVTHDPRYEVSDKGKVRSVDRVNVGRDGVTRKWKGKVLAPAILECGHRKVHFSGGGQHLVHRLVLEAFSENPEGKDFVDHIDGDPDNNCLENLRWATRKENNRNHPYTRYLQDLLKEHGIPFEDVNEWDPKEGHRS